MNPSTRPIPSAVHASDAPGPTLPDRVRGRRLVIEGQVIAVVGLALSVVVIGFNARTGVSVWWLAATLSVYGIVQGMTIGPNQTLTLTAIPLGYAGSAGALVSTNQRVGASIGIAAVTAVMFGALPSTSWGTATIAEFALIIVLVLAAIGVGVVDLLQARTC